MSTYFEARSAYPALELFTTTYLEMLAEEYGSAWDTLKAFMREESDEWAPRLAPEIREIIAADPSEAELESLFNTELRTSVNPRIRGYTYRGWLDEVERVIDDPSYTPTPPQLT